MECVYADEQRHPTMSPLRQVTSGHSPSSSGSGGISGGQNITETLRDSVPNDHSPARDRGPNAAEAGGGENGTNESWRNPLRSILGASYARSSLQPHEARRDTRLPPYTPGENGTYDSERTTSSEGNEPFPNAAAEKAAQLAYMEKALPSLSAGEAMSMSPSGPGPSSPRTFPHQRGNGTTSTRASTVTPSEVLSVYGQPPSERRESAMTSLSNIGTMSSFPFPPSPSDPLPAFPPSPTINPFEGGRAVRPKVNTNIYRSSQPSSSASSVPANSAVPLLRSPEREMWLAATTSRRSTSHFSTASVDGTRPDSAILPMGRE